MTVVKVHVHTCDASTCIYIHVHIHVHTSLNIQSCTYIHSRMTWYEQVDRTNWFSPGIGFYLLLALCLSMLVVSAQDDTVADTDMDVTDDVSRVVFVLKA